MAVTADCAGTAAVETGVVSPVQGVQKTVRDRKNSSWTVAWQHLRRRRNQRSENETRLVAVGPPGRLPSGQPRHHRPSVVASASMQALRWLTETISSRDPTLMVKEWGPHRKTA